MKRKEVTTAEKSETMLPKPMISLGIDLRALPFIYMFVSLSGYQISYTVYRLMGRGARYFPTISETGTEFPGESFLATALSFVASSNFVTLLVTYVFLNERFKLKPFSRFILVFTSITSSFGTAGVACYPMDVNNKLHHTSAFWFFGTVYAFILWSLYEVIGRIPKFLFIRRAIYVVLAGLSLIFLGAGDKFIPDRYNITAYGVNEYINLTSIGFYFLTFWNEFKLYDFQIILDE